MSCARRWRKTTTTTTMTMTTMTTTTTTTMMTTTMTTMTTTTTMTTGRRCLGRRVQTSPTFAWPNARLLLRGLVAFLRPRNVFVETNTQDTADRCVQTSNGSNAAPVSSGLYSTLEDTVTREAGTIFAYTMVHFVQVSTALPVSAKLAAGNNCTVAGKTLDGARSVAGRGKKERRRLLPWAAMSGSATIRSGD